MDRTRLLSVVLVFVAFFAVGSFGAAIYFYQDRVALQQELSAADDAATSSKKAQPAQDISASAQPEGTSEEIQSLNAYIDRLEKENAAYKQQLEQLAQNGQRGERGNRRGGPRGGFPNLEELKESNPEQYERIQQFRQQIEQQMQDYRQKRDDYFSSVDTTKLSRAQQNTLSDYQNALKEIEEAMQNPGSFEEMRELGRTIFEKHGEVQNILLEDLGNRLGADGAALQEGLQEIMSIMGPVGFGGGTGGPGNRGGMGGRGNRGGFGGMGGRGGRGGRGNW